MGPEIIKEVFGEFDLPVEAAEDLLALPELIPVLRGDAGGDGVVHLNRRTAEGDALKRVVTVFREVAEGDVGTEARGVVVDVLGVHGLPYVAGDEVEVGAALVEDQLVAGVFSVAWPVEADDAVAVVLRGEALGEFLDGLVILVAAEAVGRDDDVREVVKILIIVELAADAEAGFVDVEVFFHSSCLEFNS